jgi:phosphate transport system permease protein
MNGITELSGIARPARRLGSQRRRGVVNGVMTVLCGTAVVLALLPLVSVMWLVVSKGAASLSLSFFTSLPAPVGETGGGVGNAITGTLYMVGLASLFGVPLGIGAGIYLAERGDGKLGHAVRFTAEVLAGVPSIVLGVVAYGLVVVPMKRFSALAGAIALAILMIPTLARATEEMVRLVPRPLREASLALGVPAWKTSIFVVLRTALGGLVNAALLSVARAAGETAPLLFTALNNQYWNFRPDQPTASLTVQIYNYAISPYEDWHAKAWGAALCLLLLIGTLSLLARLLSGRRRLA